MANLASRKATARRDAKEQRKGGTGDSKTCWTCAKAGHILASCPQCGNKNTYFMSEEQSEDNEEKRANMNSVKT